MTDIYEPVIGLEIHIQTNTKRKMFCNCSADIWQQEPNSRVCPVCLGLPGALPVPNEEAIKKCQMFGLALNCKLNENSNFDRKHYFYHDLPKGYQISQYKTPFCYDGFVDLEQGKVEIVRIHLEEDTAKSIHDNSLDATLVDFNKSGMPLMEIVTAPVIKSAEHATEYAKYVAYIAEFIGVSDVNMERGNLRVEPSISVRKKGDTNLPPYKVELKNINSFKFMKAAIQFEIERQIKELEAGNTIKQQTRGWNENKKVTFLQREKESESDYRYFPEPDIPPFSFSKEYLESIKAMLPKLPNQVAEEFITKYNVEKTKVDELLRIGRLDEAELLVENGMDAKTAINEVIKMKEETRLQIKQDPKEFVKKYLDAKSNVVSDSTEIEKWVEEIISQNEKSVADYKSGKNPNAIQFLIGQVMKVSKGKADVNAVRSILQSKLL